MILQAFSLGLSAGGYCVSKCVPTLAPLLLLSPHKGLKTGLGMVCIFLAGRLLAYAGMGALAGFAGSFGGSLAYTDSLLALSQIFLGGLLIAQAFYSCTRTQCPGKKMLFGTGKTLFMAGILSSITLCPPILLAISMAMESGGAVKGLLFFICFFLATSVFVFPITLASLKLNNHLFVLASRIVCVATGIYFIFRGVSVFFAEQYIIY